MQLQGLHTLAFICYWCFTTSISNHTPPFQAMKLCARYPCAFCFRRGCYLSTYSSTVASFLAVPKIKKLFEKYAITYHFFSLFGHEFLLTYHFLDIIVFHQFLFFAHLNNSLIFFLFLLKPIGFINLLHLFHLVIIHDILPGFLPLDGVGFETSNLLFFPLFSNLLFYLSIFTVSVSDLHNLFSFLFSFLNFFPCFLFFQFEEGDAVGKQFSIIRSLFLILSCRYKGSGNFLVFIVILLLILKFLLLFWLVFFASFKWVSRGLWHWLLLWWRVETVVVLYSYERGWGTYHY